MKTMIVIIASIFMIVPALAQSIWEQSGINSLLGISPTTADFVKEVAVSDIFEIESSKLAVEKSDEATKAFANQMITDHTKTSAELKTEAGTDPTIPVPIALDSSHQSKLDRLRSLNAGADFTKQYRNDQVSAHKEAISLFERYGKGGDSDKLKSWALTALPALQHHLEMAQALDR
jgi:putative membrane protein